MTPVRVAVVGIGWWGNVLADAAGRAGAFHLVGGAARSADKRAAFVQKHSILFEFASGCLGYLGTSWVHANRTSVITLHGTEGQAWSEADGTRLFLARRGQPERTAVPLTPVDAVVEELAEFSRCVREGTRPEVGGEEATVNIAVLDAIVESARSGRTVLVESTEGQR